MLLLASAMLRQVLDVPVVGMSESALGDHARDLPVMNGIREDIKGVMAMEQGCPDHLEGLQALAVRMRTLQVTTLSVSYSAIELS